MFMFSQKTFTLPQFKPLPFAKVAGPLAFFFALGVPLATFALLAMRGLPSFAVFKTWEVFLWVCQVTWVPAVISGVILGGVTGSVGSRSAYLHYPYDLGRCFSVGAIVGALGEAFSTALFRRLTHHPFSGFWIAGATISGCIVGGLLTALILRLQATKNGPP
jgi:hypothetical protein